MDKISCEIKKLLVQWPDPSFLYKKTCSVDSPLFQSSDVQLRPRLHMCGCNLDSFSTGGGGGVLGLNLYGGVSKKKNFHPNPNFLPSNESDSTKKSVNGYSKKRKNWTK